MYSAVKPKPAKATGNRENQTDDESQKVFFLTEPKRTKRQNIKRERAGIRGGDMFSKSNIECPLARAIWPGGKNSLTSIYFARYVTSAIKALVSIKASYRRSVRWGNSFCPPWRCLGHRCSAAPGLSDRLGNSGRRSLVVAWWKRKREHRTNLCFYPLQHWLILWSAKLCAVFTCQRQVWWRWWKLHLAPESESQLVDREKHNWIINKTRQLKVAPTFYCEKSKTAA